MARQVPGLREFKWQVTHMQAITTDLAQRLAALKTKKPHAYPRDYAAELGVSEAELTPVFYSGRVRAVGNLFAALNFISGFSQIKIMARTGFAVCESFCHLKFVQHGGIYTAESENAFVAINPAELGSVFLLAAEKETEQAALLIFDKEGNSALKFYFPPIAADESIFLSSNTQSQQAIATQSIPDLIAAQRQRFAPGIFTAPAAAETPRAVINNAAVNTEELFFEIVTPAAGVLFRHVPAKAVDARGWFNILDSEFNLHLKEDAVAGVTTTQSGGWKRSVLKNSPGEILVIYYRSQG